MKSKITGGQTNHIFTAKILGKYDVQYFQCKETGFIQTEEPYWLNEAYSSAITKLDLGLAHRNETLRGVTLRLLNRFFDKEGIYLDYAGGYGLFTRLMRDKGFDFYHTDKYCENIFAEHFDLNDIGEDSKFELITVFEVFEHMSDPLTEIKALTKYSDNIFFTTELQQNKTLNNVEDWWYFVPETGQHISLYTEESLAYIANSLGYIFYTNGEGLHLFTKRKLADHPFKINRDPFLIRKIRKILKKFDSDATPERPTLLNKDWNYVKSILFRA